MAIDLELYRKRVRLPGEPPVHLSVIDISPEGPARTMVFLHGFGGRGSQWRYQLHEFSRANRVIAIDQRGHGGSDKPVGRYDMPQLVGDLEDILKVLKVEEKFVLVGHSFGGAVATEYAAKHPDAIEHLFLIATAGEFRLNPFYRLLLHLPATTLRLAGPFVKNWLSAPPYVMHAWYHKNLERWNGWSMFRGLTVPTTVIHGHHDRVFSRPLFEEVARAIPNAEEVGVGASGHLVMLERRDAVNRAIKRALEKTIRTWRDESEDLRDSSGRAALLKERPWLPFYDEGVPFTVAIPRVPLPQLLRSAANRFPHHTAIIFEGRRITYRQVLAQAERLRDALQTLGLKPGDRVMLLLPNIPQMVIAFYAVLETGATAVFSLPTTMIDDLVRQIRLTGTRILFVPLRSQLLIANLIELSHTDPDFPLEKIVLVDLIDYLPRIKRYLAKIRYTSSRTPPFPRGQKVEVYEFNRLLKIQSRQQLDLEIDPENLAAIQFTGGTTAVPKGVMVSHYNLVANTLQTRHWIPDAKEGGERFLCVLPFSHSYGLTTALNVPVALGACLILKPQFEVTDLLRTIQRYRPTIFPGVPAMYMAIKDYPGVRRFGVDSIKACLSGSAPLPVEVQEAFEKLTRGRLIEGYGLTEAGPVTHANPLYGRRKLGSIGIPLPSTRAKIVDLATGKKEVPLGQIGELAVSGPQVMLGYWNDVQTTRKVFTPDGFLLTGDVAQMDAEGYFHIIARKADMWYPHKPGKPAFPRDVEEVLYEIPQIKEVAVVAIANQPIAFVIAQQNRPRTDDMIAYCRRRLPPELVPRLVIFVDDFPRNFIGKIIRRELARRFEETHQIKG